MKRHIIIRVFTFIIFIAFILTALFLLVRMISAPYTDAGGGQIHDWGDYLPMFLECLIGIFAMLLPSILERRLHLNISSIMLFFYALFLFCSIYLGEMRSFYYRVPYWDIILHALSSVAIACIGFSLVELLNNSEKVVLSLSPAFVAIFAFCFALAMGAMWEMCEFAVDNIFATNAQKYALESGALLIGRAALADTMKDLIVDVIGALVVTTCGFLLLRQNKTLPRWLRIELAPSSDTQTE
ncbi:MAG: hypothetical protein LBI64_01195 [Coriobacteriales bacterium]|nr:hypothetical protein [Coriobacteriales bacterium]